MSGYLREAGIILDRDGENWQAHTTIFFLKMFECVEGERHEIGGK